MFNQSILFSTNPPDTMIDVSLKFIAAELNSYLNTKLSLDVASKDPVVPGNVARLNDGNDNQDLQEKIILSLVNIEEERMLKSPEKYVRADDQLQQRNPKVHLNLYCLFAANKSKYNEALLFLSFVIRFFQYRSVFTHESSPSLDKNIDKLIFDLCTLNFEQINHLWGTLGGKYLPSVLYKMRMIIIDEAFTEAEGELITRVNIEGKGGLN